MLSLHTSCISWDLPDQKLLEASPSAWLAANCLAVLRMSTVWPVPMHRVYWLNSGDSIRVGDRKVTAVRPPLFDNPTTIGICAFFSADCFGAMISSPAQNADDAPEEDLAQRMISWASGENPWVHMVKPSGFTQLLDRIRQMAPKMIVSARLPPAQGKTEELLELLARIPTSTPFVAPNQTALEQMLA